MADSDPVRLLHRRSEVGYTDRLAQALPNEPEAVSRHVQRELTERSHRDAGVRERIAWQASQGVLLDELKYLRATSFARRIQGKLGQLEKIIGEIDRAL